MITLHSTTGVQQAIYVKWAQKNPNYGDTILAYSRTFHQNVSYDIAKMAIADQICFLEKLYKKYHKVIIKKYEAKIKDKPSDSDYITAHLWEALARGYKVKLKKTIPKDTLHLYSLSKIHKITLFYPKIFNNETDAKEFTKTHSIHI